MAGRRNLHRGIGDGEGGAEVEETARVEGWEGEVCEVRAGTETKAHRDLFVGAAAPNRPWIVTLVALWGKEEYHMSTWKYAATKMVLTPKAGAEEGGWEWEECEKIWRQVLWTGRAFWLEVGDEEEGRKEAKEGGKKKESEEVSFREGARMAQQMEDRSGHAS
ncbi:hypothetical protein B0A48_18575 [Cryoendolithus antarcticus]|uniref:Uncharacterized protein n=1 Tax=Cryoendolithus antarcticus TaxID=1507870 RepID=A0A1V8S8B7_9PEZI|nr:hypothetical protein B0A48_18575 [Cryoendolithus antarcticus]